MTVDDVLDAYLASAEFADKAAITRAIDTRPYQSSPAPATRQEVTRTPSRRQTCGEPSLTIRDGKTKADVKTIARGRARVRGGPGAARMAIVILGIVFNWAIRNRLLKGENPCRFVKLEAVGTREAILEDAADYKRLFQTLDTHGARASLASAGGRCNPSDRSDRMPAVVKRRPLAACRARSHRSASPRAQGRQAHRQATHHRPACSGPSHHRAAARGPTDDFVFAPARGEGGAIELSHVWEKVRTEADLPAAITLHGLTAQHGEPYGDGRRRGIANHGALGHSQLSTVQRYIHFAKSAREALAEKAAAIALEGMAAADSNVQPLRRRRR